jgi:hypothetical protein
MQRNIKNQIKSVIKSLSYFRPSRYIDSLQEEIERLTLENAEYKTWVPPGHFYSPIPSIVDIKHKESRVFEDRFREISGIDMNEDEQLGLLEEFKKFYPEMPFTEYQQPHLRYFFENAFYAYSDAIVLYCMLRHLRPQKLIEVGSGFSSCVTLDTNELFFDNSISCSFIEPYPERLFSLLKDGDRERNEIIQKDLQEIELDRFAELGAGDILFIDSTHVLKTNSDVGYIFSDILPIINGGVYIHFHDIFYPFEYPREWVFEGRAWNEIYALRAFLQYNSSFKIVYFNTFLERFHRETLIREMPLCLKNSSSMPNTAGGIWLVKT